MRTVRLLVLATAVALLAGILASPVLAGGGNSDAAHACQQGGYADLQGADGRRFANTGECVAYVAGGGTIGGVSPACAYTPGLTGCVEFDNVVVYLGITGTVSSSWTSLSGMFSFAPVTSWDVTTVENVTGSGTWTTSTGRNGTWTATRRSSIFPTTFFDSTTSTFSTCGASDTRNIGVHFDIAGDVSGAIELGLRDATTGTNFVQFYGFSSVSGEPVGVHTTTDISGVTVRC